MSSVEREYRVRVAVAGADSVSGNVDFTLDVSDLHGVPVVTTQIVHPAKGRAESLPFSIEVLDTDGGLLANLTSSERWDALGRIVDVQFRDGGAGSWTTYGTGRLSGLSESDGPGKFLIEVSDEGWKARKSKIFTAADTCQLWPHGIKARWGEYGAATPADGSRVSTDGNLHRIKLVADSGRPNSREIFPALLRFVGRDKKGREELRYSSSGVTTADAGNFDTLRLNYDGDDYEVVSFGPINTQNDLEGTLEEPSVQLNPRVVTIHAWVFSTTTPPATGDAFLHAPTAEPSDDNPLHVGLADASHTWGIADVGDRLPQEIHPATLTRIYWEETGQVFDDASVTALEADSSFRAIAPRITETPKDPDAWFQKHVWGPSMLGVLISGEGKRKLVDMRQPQDVDPTTLPVIDASTAKKNTWQLLGRAAVNSVTWKLLELFEDDGTVGSRQEDAGADGIIASVVERGPFEGDTIGTLGTRSLTIEATALHLYQETPHTERHRGREEFPEIQSEEIFGIFQDGAHRGSIEVGRTLAETLEEGDLALLDQDSLKGPNPQTEARTGKRVVRILTMERHPTHAVTTYLDLGKDAQPLVAPTISVAQDATDEELVNVTISDIPAGATAIVAFGYSDSSTAPEEWTILRVTGTGKTFVFGEAPGDGWAHGRVKAIAPGRIRSPWATDSDELTTRPKITGERVELDGSEPVVFGDPGANTAGVRITYEVHNPGDDPSPANAQDFDATTLGDGIALDGVVVAEDQVVTAELEPWTGFSGGSVSGSAGPKVSASAAGSGVARNAVEIDSPAWIPDPDVKNAQLKIPLILGAGVQSLQVVYKDDTGTVQERYDLNVTPDTSFIHTLQDATLDELDPSGTPLKINALLGDPGSLEITPFDAADGDQGSGNDGQVALRQLIDALGGQLAPSPSVEGAFLAGEIVGGDLVYSEADWPVERTEPASRSFLRHPGTGGGSGQTAEWDTIQTGDLPVGVNGQALFTRSGAATWDDIQASDVPDLPASKITSGTLVLGVGGTGTDFATASVAPVQDIALVNDGGMSPLAHPEAVRFLRANEAGDYSWVAGVDDSRIPDSTAAGSVLRGDGLDDWLESAWRVTNNEPADRRFMTHPGGMNKTVTFETLIAADLPSHDHDAGDITGAGNLTRSNDTNVTLTLGGTPAGSLLKGVSLTLGWSGTLGLSRGGTGATFGGLSTDSQDLIVGASDGSTLTFVDHPLADKFVKTTLAGGWTFADGVEDARIPDSDASGRLLIGDGTGGWTNSAWAVTSEEPVNPEFLRHPGGMNQTATWEAISASDIAAGTFSGAFTFDSAVTMQSTLDVTGELSLGSNLHKNATDDILRLAGGSSVSLGTRILLYGEDHADFPRIRFFESSTEIARFQDGDFALGSGAKLFLDGVGASGDVYLTNPSGNVIDIVAGGNEVIRINGAQLFPGPSGADLGRSDTRFDTIYGVDLDLSGDIAFSGGGDIGAPGERVGNIYTGFLSSSGNVSVAGQGWSPTRSRSTAGSNLTLNYDEGNVQKVTLTGSGATITLGGASTNQRDGGVYTVVLTADGGTRSYSLSGVTVWVENEPDGSLPQDNSVVITIIVLGSTVLGWGTADINTPV